MSVSALFLLMLQACPDPTTASDLGHGPGGGPASGSPTPGGTTGQPLGPPPEPGSFQVEAGTGVTISGTLAYEGSQTGVFRIDFLSKEGEAPPTLAHMLELEGPGPFSVEAPPGTGSLYIVGFVDVKGDGPSASDPAGMLAEPIVIDSSPVADLVLTLSDAPDLGDFTPGDHKVTPTEDVAAQDAPAADAEGTEAPAAEEPTQAAGGDEAAEPAAEVAPPDTEAAPEVTEAPAAEEAPAPEAADPAEAPSE